MVEGLEIDSFVGWDSNFPGVTAPAQSKLSFVPPLPNLHLTKFALDARFPRYRTKNENLCEEVKEQGPVITEG